MLNMIKMDLYRMFRTKSFYVIWIVMLFLIAVTTYLSKTDYDLVMEETKTQQEEIAETAAEDTEPVNLGMTVEMPTEPGEKVTVFDLFFANTRGKFTGLILVIFAVMFSTADLNSGFIKNIGGQVQRRGNLIWSRAVALLVFTVLTMALFVVGQAISNRIFFGYLEWGNGKEFLQYFGIQAVLNFALVIICMTIAILLRNNAVSMVIAICLTMNVMMVLYSAADKFLSRLGLEDFHLIEYTVTGKITLLPMAPGAKECIGALCIGAAFGIGLTAVSSLIFEKRDI